MRLYKLLVSLILAWCSLNGCAKLPVAIPNVQYNGWIGPVGGSVWCSSANTLFTSEPIQHHTMNECFHLLDGAVFIQGADFNSLVSIIDTLCTEAGTCTYAQKLQALKLKFTAHRIRNTLVELLRKP